MSTSTHLNSWCPTLLVISSLWLCLSIHNKIFRRYVCRVLSVVWSMLLVLCVPFVSASIVLRLWLGFEIFREMTQICPWASPLWNWLCRKRNILNIQNASFHFHFYSVNLYFLFARFNSFWARVCWDTELKPN